MYGDQKVFNARCFKDGSPARFDVDFKLTLKQFAVMTNFNERNING